MNNESTPFIFYLTFTEDLPKTFYVFDRLLKEAGYILVPVRIDQLQTLAASTEQSQIVVISSVTDVFELKMFNLKVRGLLKYVLKSKRITFLQLASFSRLNDTKLFALYKNYFFLKYPLNARTLVHKITRYHVLKSEQNTHWPGGRRAGLGSMSM